MRIWAFSFAVLLGWAAATQAAPVEFKDIPAEAKWLAHVDVDAMRDSTLTERIYHFAMQQRPEAEGHFQKVEEVTGMDPRRDLYSLTFYGTSFAENQGVLIVKAGFDRARMEEKAKEAADHEVTKHGDYQIHTWTHDKGKKRERKLAGAFFKADVLVFASSVDEVKKALDVLAGKGKSLSGNESALTADVPAGTTFLARAAGMAGANLPVKSPALKKTEQISIAMGEHEGQGFYQSKLVAEDEATAQQVKEIVEGGRAMVALQHGQDPDAKALLDALKVDLSNNTLSVDFRAPVDRIWEAAKKARAEFEKHQKKHGDKDQKKQQEL